MAAPEAYAKQNGLALRNAALVSYLGLSAVTIPVGLDAAGMPVGLSLIGRAMAEPRLLAVARACEALLGTGRARLGPPPAATAPAGSPSDAVPAQCWESG